MDHHISGRPFANLNWIDFGAASVGELVYRLVKAAAATITAEMAACLYTTLLTDTGGFTYGAVRRSRTSFRCGRSLCFRPILAGRQFHLDHGFDPQGLP